MLVKLNTRKLGLAMKKKNPAFFLNAMYRRIFFPPKFGMCTVDDSTFSSPVKHSVAAWYACPNRGPELILLCVKSIDQVCFSRKFDFWKGEHLPDTKLIDCFQTRHKEINFHIIFTLSMGGGRTKRSQGDVRLG